MVRRMPKRRAATATSGRPAPELERIRNTIRVLVIDAALALDIFLIACLFGENPKFWVLLGLLGAVVVSVLTALGLWKLRRAWWAYRVAEVVAILFLAPLTFIAHVLFPLIVASIYFLAVAFVLTCVAYGLAVWTMNVARELKARQRR